MPSDRIQMCVVGGGIAGLALGHHLAERGMDVRVLEAGSRPGGNIRSEARDGYRLEWGPNGFLDDEPATLRLAEALGLRDELVQSSDAARVRWIVRGGKLRELPGKPAAFLRSDVLSAAGRCRVLTEWLQPARRDAGDESVYDFARRRIGREAAEVLVDAMVSGVYAGDARRLSLAAAFPRMQAMEREHGGLFRAMRAKAKAARRGATESPRAERSGGPMGPAGTLTSFRNGIETLVQALAGSLGDRLRCDARVASLERTPNMWRIGTASGDEIESEEVVLACPAWHAAPILRSLDAGLGAEIDAIESAPVAVVCTGYAEPAVAQLRRGFGFLVPGRERLGILGTLFDSWVFPNRAPEGRVLWRTMLGGARGRGELDRSDDDLVRRVLEVFEKLLGLRATPEMTSVVRHQRGIPQYAVGHLERLRRIETLLERHPGLHVAGNSYRGISINACIRDAETLAARLAEQPRVRSSA